MTGKFLLSISTPSHPLLLILDLYIILLRINVLGRLKQWIFLRSKSQIAKTVTNVSGIVLSNLLDSQEIKLISSATSAYYVGTAS